VTDCFTFKPGDTPLLISIPHDGRALAPGMAEGMTEEGLSLPDTDWHVKQLYEFAGASGAGIIAANYSRYVVDLNRSSTDEALYAGQLSTGLCPTRTFSGADIYLHGQLPDEVEQRQRLRQFWQPYHAKIKTELAVLKKRFGYALLWDAHSIRGEVPALFDGALPDLNIGTNGGASCGSQRSNAVVVAAKTSEYSVAVNGRFKGGFITRSFGAPEQNIHAIQLELAQRCYMNEDSGKYDKQKAEPLVRSLHGMLTALIS